MTPEHLKQRTKAFALAVINKVGELPRSTVATTIGRQLIRSGTSVGANYRAACRAKSPADFAAKMGIVLEEADECCYWLDLLTESKVLDEGDVAFLKREADELVAISVSSIKTSKARRRR